MIAKTSMVENASQWFLGMNIIVRTSYFKDGNEGSVGIEGRFTECSMNSL